MSWYNLKVILDWKFNMLKREIKLLCITCPRDDISYEKQVEFACQGGADMIQLRDKKMSDKDLFDLSLIQ